ncbi:glycosyltransferase family 2 protein [Plantactinospora sp. WMMB782]|uniref:glycosyltransferase family 2 protein n=1 Tax=Plantactinospora sp. WMMB782 TaxID=3404121 RepID=UPI003B95B302
MPSSQEVDGPTSDSPFLSVVIPTYHDSQCLALTLDSLTRQRLDPELFEVIVVGDGDTVDDQVGKSIAVRGFRYLGLPEHVGRSAARNHGVTAARGRVVVFLDSDSFADPDLLARHHDFHRGADTPRVLVGKRWEIDWPVLDRILVAGAMDLAALPAESADLRFPEPTPPERIAELMRTPWLFAYTNNISVPREVVVSAGMFDEAFGTRWGFEDLELFYRVYLELGRRSAAFHYDDRATCYHLPHYRPNIGMFQDYYANMAVAKQKHPCYEWEFTGLVQPAQAADRIRRYEASFAATAGEPAWRAARAWRRSGLDAVVAAADRPATQPHPRVLVIGLGTGELDLPDGAETFDLGLPRSPTNPHLLGFATHYPDRAFDVVVNVNLWRWFGVHDVSRYLGESLRIAGTSVLVHSSDARLPAGVAGVDDVEYFVRMLAPHLDTSVEHRDPDRVVTVRAAA